MNMAEEAFGRVVEASRKLYAKGVDVASLVRWLRVNADLLVHNADTCFISGVLYAHDGLTRARDDLFDKIDEAFREEKISVAEAAEAITTFDEYRTEKEKEAFKKMEEKCGCKWVWP
jgi:hypothetical protein